MKSYGPTSYTNFHTDAGIEGRTNGEYLDTFDVLPALSTIVGFHISMALGDYMHIVNLGILQIVLASVIIELCEGGAFSFTHVRRKDIRIGLQLRRAFSGVWCED